VTPAPVLLPSVRASIYQLRKINVAGIHRSEPSGRVCVTGLPEVGAMSVDDMSSPRWLMADLRRVSNNIIELRRKHNCIQDNSRAISCRTIRKLVKHQIIIIAPSADQMRPTKAEKRDVCVIAIAIVHAVIPQRISSEKIFRVKFDILMSQKTRLQQQQQQQQQQIIEHLISTSATFTTLTAPWPNPATFSRKTLAPSGTATPP
jgi:hypothetical protein